MRKLREAPGLSKDELLLGDLFALCDAALRAAEAYLSGVRLALIDRVTKGRGIDGELFEREQFAVHGYAWSATYVTALGETLAWARRLEAAGTLGEIERLILQAAFGGYLAQMVGGIFISQVEVVRPVDFGVLPEVTGTLRAPAVVTLIERGNTAAVRARLAVLSVAQNAYGDCGLQDETLVLMREQFRRFAEARVAPAAQEWHRQNRLIPIEIVEELAGLGVFGLTVPEQYGGLDLGKVALCVVTEELSRAHLGVGSLGTRAEIAAELIRLGGTPVQRERWLPGTRRNTRSVACCATLAFSVFSKERPKFRRVSLRADC